MALEVVGRAVMAGLWGTVTFGLLGAWLLGVGLLLRGEPRFAGLTVLGGVGALASSIRTGMTGRILPEVAGTVDALVVIAIVGLLVFFFVWLLWLAIRLWQGPRAQSESQR